jgi:hypothetical protein
MISDLFSRMVRKKKAASFRGRKAHHQGRRKGEPRGSCGPKDFPVLRQDVPIGLEPSLRDAVKVELPILGDDTGSLPLRHGALRHPQLGGDFGVAAEMVFCFL